jgi:autotransporter-associated beta strand protein
MRRTCSFRNRGTRDSGSSAIRNCFPLAALLVTVIEMISALPAPATTYTWTQNSAATQTWTTTGNWSGGTVYVSGTGNELVFFSNITTALVNGNNNITTSVPSTTMNILTLNGKGANATGASNITIGTSGSTWTLSGTTPTVNLNGVNGTQALNYTVAPTITLGADTAFTGNGTAGFTFTGVIGGSGFGITKSGTSTLTLRGNNTFTGDTTISDGTLRLGEGGRLNSSSTITINSGKTLSLLTTGAAGSSRDQLGVTGTTLVINGTLINSGTNESRLRSSTITMNNGTITASTTDDLNFGSFLVDLSRTITANGASNTIDGGSGIGLGGTAILTFDTPTISDALVVSTPLGASSALTGGLTKSGAGTVKLTGDSTFTGVININGGELWLDDDGDLVSSAIHVNSGGTFRFGQGESGNPNLPGTTFINVNTGGTFISETGEAFGGVNLNGGTVQVVGATAGFNFQGATSIWQSGTITGTSAPVITGVGGINKTTAGTVTITGMALNNSGAINIQEGVLATDSDLTAAGALTIGTGSTAGTLRLTTTTVSPTYARPVTLNGDGTIDVTNSGTTVTLSGIFTGNNFNFTKTGSGTLVIDGNAGLGNVTINGGTLRAISASGNFYNGSVTVSGNGTLDLNGNGEAGAGAITLISGTITGANLNTSSGGVDLQSGTISAILDGAVGGVTKTTAGTVTLSGNNSYTQNTTVNAGILQITGSTSNTTTGNTLVNNGELHLGKTAGANAVASNNLFVGDGTGAANSAVVKLLDHNQIANTTDLTVFSDGLLDLSGKDETVNSLLDGSPAGGSIDGTSGTPTFTVGGGALAGFSGLIKNTAGTLKLVKNSSGHLVLTGANSYSGATEVQDGILSIGSANDRLPIGTTVTLGSGATSGKLRLADATGTIAAHNQTLAGLLTSGTGTTNRVVGGAAGTSVLTLDIAGSNSYGGFLGGGGPSENNLALTKTGAGTLVLTAVGNTYTGITNVNQGKLLVNGTHLGTVGDYTVASGATLGGSGTINALVQGAGLGSPGNSPGIFTASQTDPSGGMDFAFEFTATGDPNWSNAAASINDVWRLTHASAPFNGGTFDSDNVIDIYLNVASVALLDVFRGGFFTDEDSDFLSIVAGADYNFWIKGDNAGPQSFGGFNYYPLDDFGRTLSVSTYQVAGANFSPTPDSGNGWVMQFTVVVPEPSTYVLGLLGLGGLGLFVWRRKRSGVC